MCICDTPSITPPEDQIQSKPCSYRKWTNEVIGHICTKNPELVQMERLVTEYCDCEDRPQSCSKCNGTGLNLVSLARPEMAIKGKVLEKPIEGNYYICEECGGKGYV